VPYKGRLQEEPQTATGDFPGGWPTGSTPAPAGVAGAVAVDGKTLRGSGHHPSPQVHLLAAMDHTSRAVLAQADVDGTTNEIPQFQPLLDGVELSGAVTTADALHTQHTHADWLVGVKHAAHLLLVKANQPTLHHQLATLPCQRSPSPTTPKAAATTGWSSSGPALTLGDLR
jgi:hypothetical protein